MVLIADQALTDGDMMVGHGDGGLGKGDMRLSCGTLLAREVVTPTCRLEALVITIQ